MNKAKKSFEVETVLLFQAGDARVYYNYSDFLGGWFILDVPPLHNNAKFNFRLVKEFFKYLQEDAPIYCQLDTPETNWFRNQVTLDSTHDGIPVYRWKDLA